MRLLNFVCKGITPSAGNKFESLASEDDEPVIQLVPLFQVHEQRGHGLINVAAWVTETLEPVSDEGDPGYASRGPCSCSHMTSSGVPGCEKWARHAQKVANTGGCNHPVLVGLI